MPRRVFCVGDVGVPEADSVNTVTGENKTKTDHQLLNIVWDLAASSGRLFYRNESPSQQKNFQAGSVAGSLAGLYALRHAAIGRATEGMNSNIRHVESLDKAFNSGGSAVRIAKVTASTGKSVMLLSTGVMIGLSRDPSGHNMVINLPREDTSGRESAELCRVLDVASGSDHFLCCDDHGRVYSWGGCNEFGQLGRGYVGQQGGEDEPRRVPGFGEDVVTSEKMKQAETDAILPYSVNAQRPPPSICAVACGRHHSVLLNANRTCVYTFGRGHKGQLGHGKSAGVAAAHAKIELSCVPRAVSSLFGKDIATIHANGGSDHTMVLFASGTVMSFGDNTLGVCGTGETKALNQPTFAAIVDEETGEVKATEVASDVEEKRLAAMRAPYGSPESYLYAKRIPTTSVKPAGSTPTVKSLSTSATHSVVLACNPDGVLGCYSAGLRPIRVVKQDANVDTLGALGRPFSSKAAGISFGRMFYGPRVALAGRREGVHVRAIAGSGFTAMLESGDPGSIYIHGQITVGGTTLVGTGKKQDDVSRRSTPAPTSATPSAANTPSIPAAEDEDDGTYAALLSLGPGRRAVDVFAAGSGLIILADDV